MHSEFFFSDTIIPKAWGAGVFRPKCRPCWQRRFSSLFINKQTHKGFEGDKAGWGQTRISSPNRQTNLPWVKSKILQSQAKFKKTQGRRQQGTNTQSYLKTQEKMKRCCCCSRHGLPHSRKVDVQNDTRPEAQRDLASSYTSATV